MPQPPERRVRARLVVALATLLAATVGSPAARAQQVRYTRPLEVAAPGWVRVPLAPEILRRTGPGGSLQLFGPDGDPLAFVRRPGGGAAPRRAAVPLPPEAAADGWWLPFEVAPGSRPHDLLTVFLEAAPAFDRFPEVRLEASADGESWQLLAVGEMGREEGRLTLAYPATDLLHLRLGWPAGEPAPRVVEATVEEVQPGAFRLSLARPECRAADEGSVPPRAVCRLPLSGTGRFLRRVCLTITGDGGAAFRLSAPRAGRWDPVAEAAWGAPPAEAPRCFRADLELPGGGEPLRLELYGAGGAAPGVRDAAAAFAPEDLWFEARRAGVHTLAYGPGVYAGGERGSEPPPGVEATEVAPGAEEASDVPASALSLPTAAGPAPAARFAERWEVSAEAPKAGDLYRLEIPNVVYAVAARDLADLRLLVSEETSRLQVPFVRWRPEEPVLVEERPGVEPEHSPEDRGTSRVVIGAPEPDLPLSALAVSAATGTAEAGWERRVRVREPRADDGGEAPSGAWVAWECAPRPPLPCRVSVPLEGSGPGPWVVEIDDGGGAPLPAVDLELWRRRDVLLFPWPADATPVLAAGAEGLEVPEFELSGRRDELVVRPWREAKLVLAGESGARLGAVAITLALIAAAVSLLVLLDRILAAQAPGRRSG